MKLSLFKIFLQIGFALSLTGSVSASWANSFTPPVDLKPIPMSDHVNNSSWKLVKWEVNGTPVKILRQENSPDINLEFYGVGEGFQNSLSLQISDQFKYVKESEMIGISGYASCNGFSGGVYRLVNDHFSKLMPFLKTARGCDLTSEQETRFINALGSAYRVASDSFCDLQIFYTVNAKKGVLYFSRQPKDHR